MRSIEIPIKSISELPRGFQSKRFSDLFSPSKEKKLNRVFVCLPDSWFLFYEGENIRSHVLGGNEREGLLEGE